VAAGFWAYANSLSGAFVFDDTPAIVDNPHIRTVWPLTRSMSAPPEVTVAGRPIAAFTLAVNYALASGDVRDVMTPGGPGMPDGTDARYRRNVRGYHAFNLAIHLAAALTLFGIVRRTLLSPRMRDRFGRGATPLAFAVALLWVVHPLHTESVTYIVQRVESLMGLFYLLTLYCAIRGVRLGSDRGQTGVRLGSDRGQTRRWSLAAIAACALGMGSKEVMVSAPIVVALWDFVFQAGPGPKAQGPSVAQRDSRLRWPLYAGLASTWFILAILVLTERRGQSVGFSLEGWTPWTYLLTQSEVIVHYLVLAIAPLSLVIDYGWPKVTSFGAVWPEFAALSLAVAVTAVAVARRHPLGFAGAAFFLTLAPSSSVLPIVTEIAAEHRMYLPLAAVIATIVTGLYVAGARAVVAPLSAARRRAISTAATVIIAVVAIALGLLTRQRNLDYVSQEALWRDAVRKRPSNARARVTYGLELLTQGRHAEAETQLRTAVALDESNAPAQLNLGVVLASAGKFDEGIARLERALALNPENTQIYGNLGEAYAAQGRFVPAATNFLRALETRPDDLFLLNRAGWLLATSTDPQVRNGPRAVDLASHATRLTNGQDVVSLDTLAAAYAEVGRFQEAVATATEATRLARLQNRDILSEIEARLALYRAGRQFRQ
jgi:tetratricopeptide (TPR) repeat protein